MMMNMKQKDYPLAILPIRSILVPNLAIEILVLMQVSLFFNNSIIVS